jgi:hypothetical protein
MSSIIWRGDTFHGISVESRGVFTNDEHGGTYAGQCKDGYACGLGVLTWSGGHKFYAEHGPDGQFDGRNLDRFADGDTGYTLYERGGMKASAFVSADGRCKYNGEDCAPDDPRLLALIAQVAPVEVRPAAQAPHPLLARHSHPRNRPMDRPARFAPAGAGEDRGHRGASPRRTPSLLAVRHNPTINRTVMHDHAVMRARTVLAKWSHGRSPLAPLQPPPGAHQGPDQAAPLPCHSPARRRTERCHSGRAACLRAHVCVSLARRNPPLHPSPIPCTRAAVRPNPSRSFSMRT